MLQLIKIFIYFLPITIIFSTCTGLDKPGQPNVIVMLIDDAGYADFGFMGCEDLKTPNIDHLAMNGIRFTDAHVTASVCGPSRAGLISGRYQQEFGFECNPEPGFAGIDTNLILLPEAMKVAGYKTAAFGKWHLGDIEAAYPHKQGFDYSWSFISGGRTYFPNKNVDREGHIQSIRENGKFTSFEGYLTDVLGEKAAEFIESNKNNAFFMYWAPNAVHTPMEAKAEDMALFNGHPRQTLAAMTWALDRAVGRIIESLKTAGVYENTLIFFLSDNGGATNNQSINDPLKGFKGNKFEGGHRVPFIVHWPEKINSGRNFNGLSSSLDIYPTALDVAGDWDQKMRPDLNGTSLLPYIEGKKTGNPHEQLFWRKDKMAAMRAQNYKMIRVEELGYRMYNLDDDIGESKDLKEEDTIRLENMKNAMLNWEQGLIAPLAYEPDKWNKVTWMIHEDLYNNRKVRVKSPGELKEWNKMLDSN